MSGHSKLHSIKHKKAATDAKRGKIFTKHAKLIEMAARRGTDPEMNSSLRLAIDNAKADNTPNENIQRAIKKGSGEDKNAAQIEEITYEAFGPSGTAMLIECLTNNKNRTHPLIKTIVNKKGGNIGSSGTVNWMFMKKGVIFVKKTKNDEDLEMAAIEANAEDLEMLDNIMIVYTKMEDFMNVKKSLEDQGLEIENATIKYIAKESIKITSKEDAEKITNLIEALEEDDDVSEIYTNADIDENLLAE